jgi:hypothetical protein
MVLRLLRRFRLKRSLIALYVIFLFAVSLTVYRHPYYNWDMLAYMSLVLQPKGELSYSTHQKVYAIAAREIPSIHFSTLIAGDKRKKWAQSEVDFRQLIPFYSVKPLYIYACTFFYTTGCSLTKSTFLPSVFSYFFIGLFVLFRLISFLPHGKAVLYSVCMMMLSFNLEAASLSTPDCLSAMILLLMLYYTFDKPHTLFLLLLSAASILCRVDNVISAALLFGVMYKQKNIKSNQLLLAAVALICVFFTVTIQSGGNWGLLYYPTFIKFFNAEGSAKYFSFYTFISMAALKISVSLRYGYITFFLLIDVILWNYTYRLGKHTERLFCSAFFFFIAVRILLFPQLDDRFFIAYYMYLLIVFIQQVHAHANSNKNIRQ